MTKGFKSAFGLGSGKTQQQKKGEVAMAIFQGFYNLCHGNIGRDSTMSMSEKLFRSFASFVHSADKNEVIEVSQEQRKIVSSWCENDKREISFKKSELDEPLGTYWFSMKEISNLKEEICENSQVKKDFFGSALANFIKKENVKEDAAYAESMVKRSQTRTQKLENSDLILTLAMAPTVPIHKPVQAINNLESRINQLGKSQLSPQENVKFFNAEADLICSEKTKSTDHKIKEIARLAQKRFPSADNKLPLPPSRVKPIETMIFPEVPTHKLNPNSKER